MELRHQMRIAREAAGLTQVALAARLDVSRQSIVWWEEGVHRPKTSRIMQIENALNVKLDVTERGNAQPLDKNHKALSVDPEMLRLAIAIGRLPKHHRDALSALAYIAEEKALGTKSQTEKNIHEQEAPRPDMIEIEKATTQTAEFNYIEKRATDGTTTKTTADRKQAKSTNHRRA